ncbi:MAG: hypothetical protein K2O67_02820, partial [Clostridia bacterium]|nr:hypothetical protein [Clostridia bacterium]
PTAIPYAATSDGSNKFEAYTTGDLAQYIVKPSRVSWQREANFLKNDPEWKGNLNGHYSFEWLNDNLWLPSLYETFDSTIAANSVATSFTANGGKWNVSTEKISNVTYTWLRSGSPTNYSEKFDLNADGSLINSSVNYYRSYRPALHLNLTMVNDNAVYDHKHNFGEWEVTKDATCSAKGLKERVCTAEGCPLKDSKETEEIPLNPSAHNIGAAATCTTDQTCTLCGTVIVQKTGHSYSDDWSSDATNHWHAATCGHTAETSGIAVHAWDGGTETKPAKCNEEGVTTYTCTVCSKTKTETIAKIAHTPETIPAVNPDCTNTGLTEGSKCSECGTVITAQTEVKALGHDFSITLSGTQPTCQHGGTATMKCSRCDETQEQNSADPVDHVYTNYVSNGNATCTQNGTKTAECDFGCGTTDTIEDEGSATGHTPGEEATCTTAQTCDICGTQLVAALGHNEVTDEAKAATCTETGLTEGKHCSRCDEVLTAQEEIPALGHDYQWVTTKEPTEEETGLKENLCTVCDHKDGEEVLAKLVVDDKGSVGDLPVLPPNQDYDLEIAVKESESKYNIEGLNKGYLVELFIVDGEDRNPYDDS